VIDGIMTYRIR